MNQHHLYQPRWANHAMHWLHPKSPTPWPPPKPLDYAHYQRQSLIPPAKCFQGFDQFNDHSLPLVRWPSLAKAGVNTAMPMATPLDPMELPDTSMGEDDQDHCFKPGSQIPSVTAFTLLTSSNAVRTETHMLTPMYTSELNNLEMTLADLWHESLLLIWTMLLPFAAEPWQLTYTWQEPFEVFSLDQLPTMLSQTSGIHLACHVEHAAIH